MTEQGDGGQHATLRHRTEDTAMASGKVLLGIVVGMTTGAALGILFAPDKGSVTRRKLKHRTNYYVDDIAKKYESVKTAASELTGKAKDAVGSFIGSGQHKPAKHS